MKILYPIEGDGGGAVTHVLTLSSELSKRKDHTLIVFLTKGPAVSIARNSGLNYMLIPCNFFPDIPLIWKLSKIIQDKKIDIVHTHTIRGNFYGRIAAVISRRSTILITTVHSFLIDELGGSQNIALQQKLLYKRERYTAKFVDQFISVSKELENKLLEDGIPEQKLRVITHGIRILPEQALSINDNSIRSEFGLSSQEQIIGIIGRLVPVKNHKLFLMAAKNVLRVVPNVKFLIIGDGPLRTYLYHLTKDLNIPNSVIFTGWRNDIDNCLKAIDILVLCSTTESQGLVILEAMSFFKPVIATDVNQVRKTVIDGKTGLLIPSNDLNALVEKMLKLLKDKNLSRMLGEQGRSFVEKSYSLEKMINETVNLYRTLDQTHRKGKLH